MCPNCEKKKKKLPKKTTIFLKQIEKKRKEIEKKQTIEKIINFH